jgi:phage-related minor tail protein
VKTGHFPIDSEVKALRGAKQALEKDVKAYVEKLNQLRQTVKL